MNFQLSPLADVDVIAFKNDIQESFQKGFEKKFGPTKDVILPEKDIDESLNADNAYAYKAIVDGNFVGGAVVGINEMTQENTLDLLYVKHAEQGRGIGKKIWLALEELYPSTKIWTTCTPYFERRNIHFYVNICGFKITKFYNEMLPTEGCPDDFTGDGNEGMFEFQKVMKCR